eukprot:m.53382 g.53382  ORF g.53382 m.53382 type:complete len:283 (-) comp13556_c0_seq1:680-1528(-)
MSEANRRSYENLATLVKRTSAESRNSSPSPLKPTNMSSTGPSDAFNDERPMRKRRQLPSGPGMRRAHSISFLPSLTADSSHTGRRILPDPAQGRLVAHVQNRLKEESTQRLLVVRELKDEKQKRWQLEDQLHAVQAEAAIMTKDMLTLRKQLEALQMELRDERQLHEATASKLEDSERANNSLQQQLTVQRAQAENTMDDRLEAEASVEKAYTQLAEEKRLRSLGEERYQALLEVIEERQPGAAEALLAEVASVGTSSGSTPCTPVKKRPIARSNSIALDEI